MDETPGRDPLIPAQVLPTPCAPHPSGGRKHVRRWWRQSALIGVVFALGLLQGARAALGPLPAPPAAEPSALGEVPGASLREVDAARGHFFFRPHGSTAVRPELRLHVGRWTPEPRVALACPGPSC